MEACSLLSHFTYYIFDSLGLVTLVTITAKLMLQELWQDNVSWDTALNETYQTKWTSTHQISLLPHNNAFQGSIFQQF